MNVIIADDNPKECVLISSIINHFFPQLEICGTFEDGLELMNYLDKHTPDLLISDILMPSFSGIEVCKKLRDKSTSSRIILITAVKEFEYAKAAITYGVNEFVTKPYTTSQMVDAISRTLGMDEKTLAQNFVEALRQVQVNEYLQQHQNVLEVLNSSSMTNLFAKIEDLLNLNIDIEQLPLSDWKSCFLNISDKYYNHNPHKQIVQRAIRYVEANYSDIVLSRGKIAEHLAISEAYLSNLFKQETKTGLSAYIAQTRINAAKKLLEDSSLSINEIATSVGFASTKYFHEAFKKLTHVTPSQYQARLKADD